MKDILILLLFCAANIQAQQAITASSGSGVVGGQLIDWSLGEMAAVETVGNSTLIVTQGYLQPVDETVSTINPESLSGSVQLFPNPTHDFLVLKASLSEATSLRYLLFDMSGKLLLDQNNTNLLQEHEERIDLANFAAGTYLIRIEAKGLGADTFKVLKVVE